ncbi:MAG: helix-turn-helix domain-containing protein [Muribaculaceae bacterium]
MLNFKKIENAMIERKISKAKLCSSTGIARTTLDAILNGSDTKVSTIESIASALNLRIGYLFDEDAEIRSAGRDYVEKGKIEHRGSEYHGVPNEADLRDQIAQLKSQLSDKERLIQILMDGRKC